MSEIEALTDEFTRVVLDAPGFRFAPGQYLDLHVGGSKRSFSMANTDPGRIELIVKRYPGGRFSGKLDGELKPGDRLGLTGPYGSLHIRDGEGPIAMIAGGSGIAPILSLLQGLDAGGCRRSVRLFFGARKPFCVEELDQLRLADFCVVPAGGRRVLELIEEQLCAGELQSPDVYMCGPPPMLEAAEAMLVRRGVDQRRIFQDKFTVAAEADPGRSLPSRPTRLDADSERNFSWYLQVPAFVEHGLWLALAAVVRDCLSDSVATCVCLQAAMKQRSAQAIVLYAMDLERHHGHFSIESAREAFVREGPLQPMRHVLERLSATRDWGEVIVGREPVLRARGGDAAATGARDKGGGCERRHRQPLCWLGPQARSGSGLEAGPLSSCGSLSTTLDSVTPIAT